MTQGAASLRNNAHHKAPAATLAGGHGKSGGAGTIRHGTAPVTTSSPTSPDTATRPYVHCPYSAGGVLIATVDDAPPRAAASATKPTGRPSNGKDGRRGGGGGVASGARPASLSHPTSPMGGYVDENGVRKNVCRHYLEGTCNRGSACRFYHPGASHRVVPVPRTPTRRPLTPLADLHAQEQNDLAVFSGYASPITLPASAFADAQRSTPPNNDSGNTSFTVNPTIPGGSFAAPVLSPPGKPAKVVLSSGSACAPPQLSLPKGLVSANGSIDLGDVSVTSPLGAVTRGSPCSSVSKLPSGSPQMTFARPPASPTSKQHNPYAQAH